MKYKCFFVNKRGLIIEAYCDTLEDVCNLSKEFGQIDVHSRVLDGYKYFMSVEVL